LAQQIEDVKLAEAAANASKNEAQPEAPPAISKEQIQKELDAAKALLDEELKAQALKDQAAREAELAKLSNQKAP